MMATYGDPMSMAAMGHARYHSWFLFSLQCPVAIYVRLEYTRRQLFNKGQKKCFGDLLGMVPFPFPKIKQMYSGLANLEKEKIQSKIISTSREKRSKSLRE